MKRVTPIRPRPRRPLGWGNPLRLPTPAPKPPRKPVVQPVTTQAV
jgi:hypothetical protein